MPPKLSTAAATLARAAHRVFSELACDAAITLSSDGIIEYATDSFCKLLEPAGNSKSICGQSIYSFLAGPSVADCKAAVERTMQGHAQSIQLRLLAKSGMDTYLKSKLFFDPNTHSLWLVAQDVSESARLEADLRRQLTHDAATGLPDHGITAQLLTQNLQASIAKNQGLAVLAIDIDGFKPVSDGMGRQAAEALIKSVSSRIQALVPPSSTLTRSGDAQFVLMLPAVQDSDAVNGLCNGLHDAVRRPIAINGQDTYASASIGIAMFPEHGQSSAELLQHTELAMCQAKNLGKSSTAIFDSTLKSAVSRRLSLESAMHAALRDGQFMLYYQPLLDRQGEIKGCEALLRWLRPDGSWVSPAEFIPAAESSGLITVLGDYVLRAATMQLRRFDETGLSGLTMSVNVSPRQLRKKNFEVDVQRALSAAGVSPHRLILEITEGVLMSEQGSCYSVLKKIADSGVRFALDDFGTGYSCLAYLKTYPIAALKVDRSFLANIETDEVAQSIVQAILALAHALKLYTVIEGVETVEQSTILKAMNADLFQGYLHCRPVPADELIRRYGQLNVECAA